MSRPIRAHINLNALTHNLAVIRQKTPFSKVLAVIKANAYGHGLTHIGQALSAAHVDGLAVADVIEAIRLRRAGIDLPIVCLEGCFSAKELSLVNEYNLQTVVHSLYQIEALEQVSLTYPVTVWLKLNSGMNRLGFPLKAASSLYQRLYRCHSVQKPIYLMTHFATSEDTSSNQLPSQYSQFIAAVEGLAGPRSLANSGAILNWPDTHADWIRPGILLFGASPISGKTGLDFGLRPVMTLRSKVMAVQYVKAGEFVGYGGTWQAERDQPIALVAAGYADGYPRSAPSGTPVLVNGYRLPLVGRVSMDMLAVDCASFPSVKINDPVVLWGEGLPVEEIAECANTIPYDLLCGMAQRVPYVLEKGENHEKNAYCHEPDAVDRM